MPVFVERQSQLKLVLTDQILVTFKPGASAAPTGRASRPPMSASRGKGYSTGAYCSDFGGTSSATPLVAGVAGLMLSANRSLRWDEVRDVLTSTADKIDSSGGDYRSGHSLKYGFGRVNAEAAVTKAKGIERRVPKVLKKR